MTEAVRWWGESARPPWGREEPVLKRPIDAYGNEIPWHDPEALIGCQSIRGGEEPHDIKVKDAVRLHPFVTVCRACWVKCINAVRVQCDDCERRWTPVLCVPILDVDGKRNTTRFLCPSCAVVSARCVWCMKDHPRVDLAEVGQKWRTRCIECCDLAMIGEHVRAAKRYEVP